MTSPTPPRPERMADEDTRIPLTEVYARLRAKGIHVRLCGADPRGLSESTVREIEAFAERLSKGNGR